MELRRLHPDAQTITADEAIGGLALADRAPSDRPYVICNMVATADGKATVGGRAGPIGNEADRRLFHQLRTQVDALLVGTRTLAVERYGRLVRDPALREKRVREGLSPDPLACIISHRLEIPVDIGLFQDPASRVVIYTSSDRELPDCPAEVEVVRVEGGDLAPRAVLARLRRDHGVRSLLCEGGPTLNASLLQDDVMDELFLSLAPKLAGGLETLTIVAGMPLEAPRELELLWVLEAEGHLFLRYGPRS